MEIQTTEKRITEGLPFLEDNNVRFAVVKLISCNGAESNFFADARCGFEVLQDHNKVPSFLPFTVMFEKGVSILRRLENVNTVNNSDGIENLQDPIKEALVCLDKFYKTKGEVTKVVTPLSQSACMFSMWNLFSFERWTGTAYACPLLKREYVKLRWINQWFISISACA